MFKRSAMGAMVLLIAAISLVACSGGDLAKDLTPIPTLPKGEEPELVEALRATPVPPATVPESGAAADTAQLIAQGRALFVQCEACHGAADGVGPALTGMGARAATRVAGLSAAEYLRQSIVQPGAYIVEGFSDIMPKNYGEQFSETELQALVAYILAETGEEPAPVEETAPAEAGEEAEASLAGDPENGERLFVSACSACHGAADGAGPALTGMGARAATRVAGLSAAEYLYQSIVEPGAFMVEGFADIMPKTYGQQFSEQELNDLVAYLLTQ